MAAPDRDHRRSARPRCWAPRRRHGPVGDPLRGARGAPDLAGARLCGLGQRRDRRGRGHRQRRPAGALPARDRSTCERVARRWATAVGRGGADRARRRPLDRAGDARRAGGRGRRSGRGALDRRPRRPQHATDHAERQRARDAAGRGARPRRRGLRERGVAAAGARADAHDAHRRALTRRRRARARRQSSTSPCTR